MSERAANRQLHGYCAWHPDHGFTIWSIAFSPKYCNALLDDQIVAATLDPESWEIKAIRLVEAEGMSSEIKRSLSQC